MSALDQNPTTTNFLNPLNFRFQIKRAPAINFFIQKVNIPSITLPKTNIPTPFQPIPISGKPLDYGTFNITFKVDEDFQNYLEIFHWIKDLGFSNSFGEYKRLADKLPTSGEGLTSDITLLVLNATQNPTFEFTMQDAFPNSLSEILFDTTNPDVTYVTATATFHYLELDVKQYRSS